MLHSLEHVRDHQNPLAGTPTLVSCQAPQLGRPRFAPEKVCRHPPSPKHSTLAYQLYHIWGSPEAGIRGARLMATTGTSGYRPGLVDLKAGQISREIFVHDEIYQQELERLFARVWLFVGHESQIPNPGDFFVSGMGEESVILCRDRAGKVHVFLNSCRHRGMKVCRYDEGNTPIFTCPYHGWSYGTDGSLVGVPYFREAYHSELDRTKWHLVEVAQLCRYKGSVWANWDASA